MHFYSILLWESKIFCSSQWVIQEGSFEKKQFFHRWDQKRGFNLSTLRNTFQHSLLLKFHHALYIFIDLRFAALVHFYSILLWESKIFCSSQWFIREGSFEKKQFFHRWDQKVVLTCLRSEIGSNLYYFWSFTKQSIFSSIFFRCPGALLLHFTLREQDILFISRIHPRGIFWKEAIFSQMRPKK